MVQSDVALRKDVKLESLKDGREIRLCMDGSWLPFFELREKDKNYGEAIYVYQNESFDDLWNALKTVGNNNIDRSAKASGHETQRMKAQREKRGAGLRIHKTAVKKSQQYSGVLFKAMFNRMRASSGNRVPWLDFIEDLLVEARRNWFNGKYTGGEWIYHYLGSYEEDFRFEEPDKEEK